MKNLFHSCDDVTRRDFAKTIATEIPLWKQVAKDNDIKSE